MNNLLKRILSLTLAILMVIGMMPLRAVHAEEISDGDEGDLHVHSYEAVVTPPTCTATGYTTYTCACGDSYVADETPVLDHTYGEDGKCVCGAEDPNHTATEVQVDSLTGAAIVTTEDELKAALEHRYALIRIDADFQISSTYYITYSVNIYSEEAHTLTRTPTFGGDVFVVGEAADGTASEEGVTLTLGKPDSGTRDLLTIDGNKDNMSVDVVGTVIYIAPAGQADLYENLTVVNCLKVGNERALSVTDNNLSSNPKNAGGAVGILVQGGALNIYGGVYKNNGVTSSDTSNGYGGAFYIHSAANIYGGLFENNTATARAGAIYGYRRVNIYAAEFIGNSSGVGGAIYMPASTSAVLNIEGTKDESGYSVIFKNNVSTGNGGAVSYSGPAYITNAVFEGNESAKNGGVLYATGSSSRLVAKHTEFRNNTAATSGGVLYMNVTEAEINHCTFSGNKATSGAGIYIADGGVATLNDVEAIGNATTTGSGGFVYNANSSLTVYDSVISENAAKMGSALYFGTDSTGSVYNTVFEANACFESNAGNAGAVYIYPGSAKNYLFHTCTFKENSSAGLGGAFLVNGEGVVEMYNITATGNSALKGGFMYETKANTDVTISGLTVSGNTATSGGPIIWGNTTNADLYINKNNYTDLDVSGELNSDYWAGAIYNALKVYEVDTAVPTYETPHITEVVVTPPTCTSTGYTTYTCACGDSVIADETPVLDHAYGADGKCACGAEDPNHVHSYEAVVTPPTCTSTGYTTYTCPCSDTYTADETPTLDHTYGEDGKCECGAACTHAYTGVVTAPTCMTTGYTTYTCGLCGDSYTADETPVSGHAYGEDGKCVCGAEDPNHTATEVQVDSLTGAAIVTSEAELAFALENRYALIRIDADFQINRTYYITYSVNIYTEEAHTLTRTPTFGGDVFVVGEAADGTASEEGVTLTLGKPDSNTRDLLTIDGNKDNMSVDVVGTVIYIAPAGQADLHENLTVANCLKVGNERALSVTDNNLSSNPKNAGGAVGILVQGGALNIYGGVYKNNAVAKSDTSNGYGGAFYIHSTTNIYGGLFENNTATARAGAIYGYRRVNIYAAEFIGNTSALGGAIYMPSSTSAVLNIEGTKYESGYSVIFKDNVSTGSGGAVSYSGPAYITNAVFEENEAAKAGGALYSAGGSSRLVAKHTEFLNNTAATDGGAIYLDGTKLEVNHSSFSGNRAENGAGIYMAEGSEVTLNDVEATDNGTTTGYGGFVYNTKAALTVYDSVISENTAKAGSALYLTTGSSANVYNTVFEANACFESNASNAGAVYIYPSSAANYLFHSCTFKNNSSAGLGGAFLVNGEGVVEMYNITAIGNSALKGGFMYETKAGTVVTISGLTVSGNTATSGGPIIWGNTANAKLNINKNNYTDLDVSGELNSDYWTAAIYNALKVYEVDTAVPTYENPHITEVVVTPPTCTSTGYTTYTCACGYSVIADEIPALDHTYGEDGKCECDAEDPNHVHSYEAVVTHPTCTSIGYTTYTCPCGDTYTADEKPALDHTYGTDGKCECGEVCAHAYTSVVTDPTCTSAGYTVYTCGVCGNTYTADEKPVLDHTYGEDGKCECGAEDPNHTVTEVQVDSLTGAAIVTSEAELTFALENRYALIRIDADFQINRTYYITYSVNIYTEEAHTLTRTPTFGGDVFVVGEAVDGTASEEGVTLTLGKPDSNTRDLLTIDGNKDKMVVDVVGTVIYIAPAGQADLHENLTVANCLKVGNERALSVTDNLLSKDPKNVGGAVGILVQGGALNIYGGVYKNNAVAKSDTSNGYGGAFYIHSAANIYGGLFENNTATARAGAIYGYRRVNIYAAKFIGNSSVAGGAIYMPSTTGAVLNIEGTKDESGYSVIFKNNVSSGNGGAVSYSGPVYIVNAIFEENEAKAAGGALYGTGEYSRLKVENTEFRNNKAGTNGGALGIAFKNSGASVEFELYADSVTFAGNSAGQYGGAVYVQNGARAYLVRSNLTDNSAASGGAVYVTAATLEVNHSSFSGNEAENGAGIYMAEGSEVTLNDVEAIGNGTTSGYGGFVYNTKSALTVYDSVISENTAKAGSALYLTTGSSANVYNTVFEANACFESNAGNAGAVYIYPNSAKNYLFHTCTFKDNSSAGLGGAFLINGEGVVELYNITATGNSALKGGFMYETKNGTVVTISGLTVSGNTATSGGPIIWGNTNNAKLYINKNNYTDLDVSGELDSDYYWAGAICNALTVYEVNTGVPTTPFYEQPESDPVYLSGDVRSAQQLAGALANGFTEIRILNDFEIDRTFYITKDTKIYSEIAVTLTRAADFADDIFVVGESSDGVACEEKVTLTLGNPESAEQDLLTIDGNSQNMTVTVTGSVIFVCCNHQADLYENVTITNCTKTGNKKTLTEAYGVSYPKNVGGAVGIVSANASMNIYGGKYTNNHGGQSGTAGYGGAFYNFGTMKVYGGLFEGNTAYRAGAFYNYRKLYIYNAQINGNHATSLGGAIYLPASTGAFLYLGQENTLVESSVIFAGNTSDDGGGAIYSSATMQMENTLFNGNSSAKGGAIYVSASSNTSMTGVDFVGNEAAQQGGGVYINAAMVSATDCEFKDNVAVSGAAVYANGRSSEATEEEVEFFADQVVFSGNAADDGGAVYLIAAARATILNSQFLNNTATASGGAIYLDAETTVNMNGITATGNTAAANGGFLNGMAAEVNLYNSKVSSGAAENGAGLYLGEAAFGTIYNTVFEENMATGNGGALSIHTDGGDVVVYSSTFTKNTAAQGGAVSASDNSIVGLYKNTANENSAEKGGFLFAGTTVTVNDLTVSGNAATIGGSVAWGDDEAAVLILNKTNYTDKNVDGALGDDYWNTVIGGTIQVLGTTEKAPFYPDYGNEDPGEIGEYFDVSSADELEAALASGKPLIRIVSDFQLDRTFYITANTTIFSTSNRTLTRAADFGGDIFVVGESAEGILCKQKVTLTLGNPNSSTKNLLKINGNSQNMTVPVSGTVIFVCGGAEAKLYENLTVLNCTKTANEKTNTGAYGVSYPDTVGGAVAILAKSATMTIYGGTYTGNSANTSGSVSSYGGAFYNFGVLTVYGGTFSNNHAVRGGAFYNYRVLRIYKATITKNTASVGGMVYLPSSTSAYLYLGGDNDVVVSEVTISENISAGNGGAIYSGGTVYVQDTLFQKNEAKDNGGAIYNVTSSNLTVTDAVFAGNRTKSYGGAVYLVSAMATLEGAEFKNNSALYGGAVYVKNQSSEAESYELYVANTTFAANNSTKNGGAVYLTDGARSYFDGATFTDNTATKNGGAVYTTGSSVEMHYSTFSGNMATENGGAFAVSNESVVILEDCIANGNKAVLEGGFAYVSGSNLNMYDCVVSGSTATSGTVSFVDAGKGYICTTAFENNSVTQNGGVATVGAGSTLFMHSCGIANNTASGFGGGIYVYEDGSLELYSAKTNGNAANNGGVIALNSDKAQATIIDLTVSGNSAVTAGPVVYGIPGAILKVNKNTWTDSDLTGAANDDYWATAIAGGLTVVEINDKLPGYAENGNENAGDLIHSTDVTTAEELEAALKNGDTAIRITADIVFDRTFTVKNNTTIFTTKAHALTRAVGFTGALFNVSSGVVLTLGNPISETADLLSISGGDTTTEVSLIQLQEGAQVDVYPNLTVKNCVTTADGAVFSVPVNAKLNIYGGNFENNSAANGAVAAVTGGTIQLGKAIFKKNTATAMGGAIYLTDAAQAVVNEAKFQENKANNGGAVALKNAGTVTIIAAEFASNVSKYSGGAVYANSAVTVNEAVFTGNKSATGGAVYATAANLELNKCSFQSNTADNGGAVALSKTGTVAINACEFAGNVGKAGGALHTTSAATVTESVFTGNKAPKGGAVYVTGAELNLTKCSFTENTAAESGGAAYVTGAVLKVQGGTFSGNAARNGGVLYCRNADALMQEGIFANNAADNNGGMFYLTGTADLQLHKNEATANTAAAGGVGYLTGTATATVSGFTPVGNTASVAGPIFYGTANAVLMVDPNNTTYTAEGELTVKEITTTPAEPQPGDEIVGSDWTVTQVTNAEELERALAAKAPYIRIAKDFVLDRTYYIPYAVTIFSTEAHTLTRAHDFTGDLFVVGVHADGTSALLDGHNAKLTLGNPLSTTENLLVIDGNRDNLTVDVAGTVLYVIEGAMVDLYHNVTICNHLKLSNDRTLTLGTHPNTIGGAMAVVLSGNMNIYGGNYHDNQSNVENSTTNPDNLSVYGGAIYNRASICIYDGNFFRNEGARGGFVYNYGVMKIFDGHFFENYATKSGGAYYAPSSSGVHALIGSDAEDAPMILFENNTAKNSGGAVYNGVYSGLNIYGNTMFVGNKAESGSGGAIYTTGQLMANNIQFVNNSAANYGGALHLGTGSDSQVVRYVELNGCAFSDNSAKNGGAISQLRASTNTTSGSKLFMTECEFAGNTGTTGGVLYISQAATMEATNCKFYDNVSTGEAGVAYIAGLAKATFTGCAFENNSATNHGGACSVRSATLNLKDSTITGNTSSTNGGAIYISYSSDYDKNSTVNITGSVFSDNSGSNGGVIYATKQTITKEHQILNIKDSVFENNKAASSGGAIRLTAGVDAYMRNVEFRYNQVTATSGSGGAISAGRSTLEIDGATFTGNSAKEQGGAIALGSGATVILNNITASENESGSGGFLHNAEATLELYSSYIYENTAKAGSALYLTTGSSANVYSTTFEANTCVESNEGNAGAVYIYPGSATKYLFHSCTFKNNTSSGLGGAFLINGKAVVEMYNITATGNSAMKGGFLYETVSGTTVTISGLTVSGNTATVGGNIIWGNTKNAVLNLNKALYTDADHAGELDDAYWAEAISNLLTVNSVSDSIPDAKEYTPKTETTKTDKENPVVPVSDVLNLALNSSDADINSTYNKFERLDNSSNFMSRGTTYFDNINGNTVSVDTYVYGYKEPDGNMQVGLGLMIYQAMLYKQAHPEEEVYIDATSYRFSTQAAVNINRNSRYFGYMRNLKDRDYDEYGFVRIAYLLVSAAKMGINVTVIGQLDGYPITSSAMNFEEYFTYHLNDPCDPNYAEGYVRDYMNYQFCDWTLEGKGGTDMMHNKMCTVSAYLDMNGNAHYNAVWSSSTNYDGVRADGANGNYKIQTATIVSDHAELYRISHNYIQMIARYCEQEDVIEWHDLMNTMNTEQIDLILAGRGDEIPADQQIVYLGTENDDVFELYFTPFGGGMVAWNEVYNPYCKYVRELYNSDDYIEFSWNAAEYHVFSLGTQLETLVSAAFHENRNVKNKIYVNAESFVGSVYDDLIVGEDIGYKSFNTRDFGSLHNKDILMSYSKDGQRYFVSMLNCLNGHSGAMYYQANFMLVIKETECSENSVYKTVAKYTTLGDFGAHAYGEEMSYLPEGEMGYTYRECERCGHVEITGDLHHESNWIIDKVATISENGLRHTECLVCGTLVRSEEYSYAAELRVNLDEMEGLTFHKSFSLPIGDLNSTPHTLEATIQVPTNLTGRGGVIVGNFDENTGNQISLEVYSGGRIRLYVKRGSRNINCVFSTDIRSNDPVHVAVTVNGKTATLYVNGAAVETKTMSYELPEILNNFVVGGDNRIDNTQYFKGTIYSVSLFADVRSAEEIKQDSKLVVNNEDSLLYSRYYEAKAVFTSENGKTFSKSTLNRIPTLTGSPLTFEAVVQVPMSVSGRGGVIVGNYDGAKGNKISLEIYNGGRVRLYAKVGSRDINCVFATDIRSNSPVHIAVTVHGREVTLYVNGVAVETQTLAHDFPSTAENFVIGGDNRSDNPQYFRGTIYSVNLYSDVRTAAEIKQDAVLVMTGGDSMLYGNVFKTSEQTVQVNHDGQTFTAAEKNSIGTLPGNPNTIEAWIQVSVSQSSRGGTIVGNYTGSSSDQINLELYTKGRIRLYTKSGSKKNDCIFSTDIRSDKPVHIAVVVEGKTATLYVNGAAVETKTLSYELPNAVKNYVIGGDNRKGNTQYFKGTIYSINLYDDARTAEEVKQDSLKAVTNLNAMLYLVNGVICTNGSVTTPANTTISKEHTVKAGNLAGNPNTIEAWIQVPKSMSSRAGVIVGNYSSDGAGDQINLEIYTNGRVRLFTNVGKYKNNCIFSTDIRSDKPVHIAVTINGRTATLYVDGVAMETRTLTYELPNAIESFVIGGDNRKSNAYYFKGSIYSVALFDNCRTAAQIQADSMMLNQGDGLLYSGAEIIKMTTANGGICTKHVAGGLVVDRTQTNQRNGIGHTVCGICGEAMTYQEIKHFTGDLITEYGRLNPLEFSETKKTPYDVQTLSDTPLTYEVLLQLSAEHEAEGGVLISNYDGGKQDQFSLEIYTNGNPRIYIKKNGTEYTTLFSTDVRAERSVHVAVTIDGTTAKLYVDGALKEIKTLGTTLPVITEDLSIGGDGRSKNSKYFKGRIYAVGMFSDVRTAEEIGKDALRITSDATGLIYEKIFE